jgi:ABC-2 type transport system permease protein
MRAAGYLSVSRIAFMDRLSMRADVFLGVMMSGVRLAMARLLWQAVYAGRPELGGMSLPQMTSYYLIVSFLRAIDQSEPYVWEFSAEIRGGQFGKYLTRPIRPLPYFVSLCAGRGCFQALLAVAAAALWALPFAPLLAPLSPLGILASLPVVLLGLFCLACLNYLTALLAFAVQDILPYHMIKSALIELCSGALVPLAVMPPWARSILSATPFPALADLPASLMLGTGFGGYLPALGLLSTWALGLAMSCNAAYARLSGLYEEAGS